METSVDDRKIWFRLPERIADELDRRVDLLNRLHEKEGSAARVSRSGYIGVAVQRMLEDTAISDKLRAKELDVRQ